VLARRLNEAPGRGDPRFTKEPAMTRLDTIVTRQRQSRRRDLVFACFVALVAVIGATTVGAAVHEAVTVAQR